ncbi:alpha-keto acid decarboxylase family protein [Kineococcus rubinsiae]|uniref:alpha-keto acid decarboxylase family protein n=1 Tax=Kineococcus rubinsiae TaxID=2609562 RepID=UPI00142F54A8|nr:thiamine pyrophosphate-binding protein [Kineococcus rubinsiae]NIZ92610.1 alpha-keto acid decarboxylase family protein [Kineococcus rubinsiae]
MQPLPGTETVTVAEYLGHRLLQAGVEHLFGVPGDFNLTLLDGLARVEGLTWVRSPNELGAGYAADAYARRRGLAALVTTYGVGELSCFNAVAGSAAEDVPVLHVAGSPATTAVARGVLLHHTLADGVFDRFSQAYAQVTVVQETLTAQRAAEQVDAAVLAATVHRRPAYLSVPADLAELPVDATRLATPLTAVPSPADVAAFGADLAGLLAGAERPVLVVGHLVDRCGLAGAVLAAAVAGGVPFVTTLSAKGCLDEDHPLFAGTYAGTMVDASAAALVEAADVVVHLGVVMTDVLSGFFTHRPADARTVRLEATTAVVGDGPAHAVGLADAVGVLAEQFAARPAAAPVPRPGPPAPLELGVGPLTQQALWSVVQDWLPSGTALLADTGTSFWGAAGLRLPADTVFVGQPVWNSIGYALPAVLGQGLADPGRRPVLLIGDGAAQMTVQDLGSTAAAGVRPVVVLLNNAGYTIERALQSPTAGYNDVTPWDWHGLAAALVGPSLSYHLATTAAELAQALKAAGEDTASFVLVEAVLDPFDAPPLLRALAERNSATAG